LDGPVADARNDPIFDRLAGQILARPVGDVQALGDRLQAGQSNDLGPLEGGKSGRAARRVAAETRGRATPSPRSGGRSSRSSRDRAESGQPRVESLPRRPRPGRSAPAGPGTRGATDYARSRARSEHHGERSAGDEDFDRAWGNSGGWTRLSSPAYRRSPISCIITSANNIITNYWAAA
jgi:hypothetical protein